MWENYRQPRVNKESQLLGDEEGGAGDRSSFSGSLALASGLLTSYICTSGAGSKEGLVGFGANELELPAVRHAALSSASSLATSLSFPQQNRNRRKPP